MSLKTKGGKSLINVAMLESFRAKRNSDYLDCFLPLVCTCLADDKSERITVDKIYDLLKVNFLTNIPKASVKAIIKRAVKRNLLQSEDGIYVKNSAEIEKMHLNYKSAAKEIIKAQNELGKQFVEYVKNKYSKDFDENVFFEEYAKYSQKYLLDFIELSLEPTLAPSVVGKSIGNTEYLISNFLKDCWSKEHGFPEYVEINMRGFLLANYLGYFENNLQDRLKVFLIYFDTPVLIGVLGFDGPSTQSYYKELIQHLLDSGIKLFVFENTLEELDGILYAYQQAIKYNDKKSMNPSTYSFLINKGHTVESIETIRQLVKKQLLDLGLVAVELPEYNEKYLMNESKFKNYLVSKGFSLEKLSTQRDVDYVSAIHRLRFARKIDNTSDSIPVYFTNNRGLVKATINFFSDDEGIRNDENNIPHCVTDTFLASLILLKNPVAGVKASKRKLLAEAYSSIHVNDEFWNKFYKRVDSLLERGKVDEQDYALLRFNNEIRGIVGDQKVINDLEDVDDLKVFDILKTFKERVTQEKDEIILKHELQINKLDDKAEALLAEKTILTEENEILLKQVEVFSKSENVLDGFIGFISYCFILSLIVFILGITFIDSFQELVFPGLVSYKFVVKIFVFTLGIFTLLFGFNPKVLQAMLKNKIRIAIAKVFE